MRVLTGPLTLAILSCACSDQTSVPLAPAASTRPANNEPVATPVKPWRLVRSQGIMNFVQINESSWRDEDQYRLAIADICAGQTMCQVMFWKDLDMVPVGLPMSAAQEASKVAHWQFNGNTGHRQLLWSCEIVNDPAHCF